jgi:hypothetical protein
MNNIFAHILIYIYTYDYDIYVMCGRAVGLVLVHASFDLQENFFQNSAQLVHQMPRSLVVIHRNPLGLSPRLG